MTGAWARGREMDLIDAVQSAFLTAIKTPEWDRDIIVELFDKNCRIVPAGKSERYTRIEIKLFSGRSLQAKRNLYQAIVKNLELLGVPNSEIKILLIEIPAQDWGIRGGVPASEVDMGYQIDVWAAPPALAGRRRASLCCSGCGRSSVVERQLPKLYVVGSIPIARSKLRAFDLDWIGARLRRRSVTASVFRLD